jgi:thioredoxin reductase/Fe-S-cluster-containing hydrogenase component 2
MIEREVVIVGAGPAGLSAAIEAGRAGADTLLIDENSKAGGQLFKQIHKFFGSKEHQAGVRGTEIGRRLLEQAAEAGVETWLDTVVWGIFEGRKLSVLRDGRSLDIHARAIVLATGAMENALSFPGWTLPGVISAGAAQTMINIHRVLPGKRVLMVGAGNVGVIVAYQLMQAGAEVVAVVEALPKIGGYGVHAAKIRRAGVPILVSHTILEAAGVDQVEAAVIARLDADMQTVAGSERMLGVDTICLAVGLTPLVELALMAGCQFTYISELGGHVPVHNDRMETSIPGIYIAGDASGIEEANTAMEEGRLAGIAIARDLGYLAEGQANESMIQVQNRLSELRLGQFGEHRATAKAAQLAADPRALHNPTDPSEVPARAARAMAAGQRGVAISGVHCEEELQESPGYPDPERLQKGGVAVIECVQDIPCNPCELACHRGAIRVGVPITNLPILVEEDCSGCGLCIADCPGLAVFVVDLNYSEDEATVTFPYEYLPLPQVGDVVEAVGRAGEPLTRGRVTRVQNPPAFNRTAVVTVAVPKEYGGLVRSISRGRRA